MAARSGGYAIQLFLGPGNTSLISPLNLFFLSPIICSLSLIDCGLRKRLRKEIKGWMIQNS